MKSLSVRCGEGLRILGRTHLGSRYLCESWVKGALSKRPIVHPRKPLVRLNRATDTPKGDC